MVVTKLSKRIDEKDTLDNKKGISKILLVIIVFCIVGSAIALIYSYYRENTTYTSYIELDPFSVPDGSKYVRYGNGYIRYTSDGAEATRNGSTVWNISFDLKKPITDVCGDYCVFADRGGHEIRVTDGKGGNYRIDVSDRIVDLKIASQGVVAVWTDSVERDHFYIYNYDGSLLLDIETSIYKNGFPIAFDLSDDGKKLVTSYANMTDEVKSWVTFYNFGEVGQNYSDRMVGSFEFEDKIIPDVRFVDNSTVACFYENGCTLYNMKEIPSEIVSYEADRLIAIANDSEHICMAESETDGTTSFVVMDKKGRVKKNIVTGIAFGGMYIEDDELIVYNNTNCIIYFLNGKEKFRAQITDGMRSIYPAGKDKYTVIKAGSVSTIQLQTEK